MSSKKTSDDNKDRRDIVKNREKPIKLLRGALRRNELFSSLYLENSDDNSVDIEHNLVDCFERYEVESGESLCIQGQENNYFYRIKAICLAFLVSAEVEIRT